MKRPPRAPVLVLLDLRLQKRAEPVQMFFDRREAWREGFGAPISCCVTRTRSGQIDDEVRVIWTRVAYGRTCNPENRGMLCVGCVEERLGRRLQPDDFTDAEINQHAFLGTAALAAGP